MKKKKQKTKKNRNRRMSIKMRVLVITTLPLLFACVTITFFASWTVEKGIQNQIFDDLRTATTGALLSLDSYSAESFHLVDDELYKGDFNVTQNMGGIDGYAKDNDVAITFFYDDVRRATTILDENGDRLTGTTADPAVVSAVLDKGQEYTTTDIVIGGEPYYGFYMPLKDTDDNIIGMAFAGKSSVEVTDYIRNRILFILIIAVLNYISCCILAVYVTNKDFIKPIYILNTAAKELANGNTNFEIHKVSNDEFGDLTDSFHSVIENINTEAHVAEQMAAGDLTVTHEPVSDEDVMGLAITKMVQDNNANLSQINIASEKMVTGVEEIAAASNSLAQGTTEQASAIEQITTSISGIADSARINAEGAGKANKLMKKTKEEALQSNSYMNDMMSAMKDISEASENISKIMNIIDDIASQTNIISLNASVEAARAGEQGRGFAVVAEEIRNLAAKSAEAASDSAKMIEDSIKKTETGLKIASETAESLEAILASVEEMAGLINEIAELSVRQSASVDQVNTGINQIANVLQTNSATSEECAATSAQLSELADQLKDAVAKYKLKNDRHDSRSI